MRQFAKAAVSKYHILSGLNSKVIVTQLWKELFQDSVNGLYVANSPPRTIVFPLHPSVSVSTFPRRKTPVILNCHPLLMTSS